MAEEELVMEDMPGNQADSDKAVSEMEEQEPGQGIDVYQFEGKQAPIEIIKPEQMKSKFGTDGKQLPPGKEILTWVLRVETAPVYKGTAKDGEEFTIRGSELFAIKEKKDEKTGKIKFTWSGHEKASLHKFLKKMRVKHPTELKGKLVILTTRPTNDPDRTFLGFVKQ